MKKKIVLLGITMILLFVGIFSGCKQAEPEKENLYYTEGAVLSKTDVQTIVNPYQNRTDLTFAEVKEIRNKLRLCSCEDFFSQKDVTKKECTDYLTSHGCTPAEADTYMDLLDDAGNAIMFFTVYSSTNKLAYIYAEKQ